MTGGVIEPFILQYSERSQAARDAAAAAGSPVIELRYGPKPANTVDLAVPPGQGPYPLLVYIHGGYWQALSKHESFFPATDCLAGNIAFATVDYTLVPAVTLDALVEECRAALAAVRDCAGDNRIDPDRIVVCGSSAGGHLTAMMGLGLEDGWRPAAVAPISGVFELEPLIGTSINDAVGLEHQSANRNSPMLADLAGFPAAVISCGEVETEEFKLQSRHFAALLAEAGVSVEIVEIPERNHFDVVYDCCNPQTALGAAITALIEGTDSDAEL